MSTETLADKPACFHPRGDVQHTRMDTRAVKDGQSAGALDTALEHAFGGTKETVKSVVNASFHYTSNYVDGAARTVLSFWLNSRYYNSRRRRIKQADLQRDSRQSGRRTAAAGDGNGLRQQRPRRPDPLGYIKRWVPRDGNDAAIGSRGYTSLLRYYDTDRFGSSPTRAQGSVEKAQGEAGHAEQGAALRAAHVDSASLASAMYPQGGASKVALSPGRREQMFGADVGALAAAAPLAPFATPPKSPQTDDEEYAHNVWSASSTDPTSATATPNPASPSNPPRTYLRARTEVLQDAGAGAGACKGAVQAPLHRQLSRLQGLSPPKLLRSASFRQPRPMLNLAGNVGVVTVHSPEPSPNPSPSVSPRLPPLPSRGSAPAAPDSGATTPTSMALFGGGTSGTGGGRHSRRGLVEDAQDSVLLGIDYIFDGGLDSARATVRAVRGASVAARERAVDSAASAREWLSRTSALTLSTVARAMRGDIKASKNAFASNATNGRAQCGLVGEHQARREAQAQAHAEAMVEARARSICHRSMAAVVAVARGTIALIALFFSLVVAMCSVVVAAWRAVHRSLRSAPGILSRACRSSAQWVVATHTQLRQLPSTALKRLKRLRSPVDLGDVDEGATRAAVEAAGYPYERVRVETADGYQLTVDRLPRPGAKRVAFFQHGVLDSSYSWVAGGPVGAHGSLAMRAFDDGCDVFLGNFRGCVASRRHRDDAKCTKKDRQGDIARAAADANMDTDGDSSSAGTRSSLLRDDPYKFWDFSVNEHAYYDLPAMLDKIEVIKQCELGQKRATPRSHEKFAAHGNQQGDHAQARVEPCFSKSRARKIRPNRRTGILGGGADSCSNNSVDNPSDLGSCCHITCVAHSLGAASVLMYLLNAGANRHEPACPCRSARRNRNHCACRYPPYSQRLARAVLLSPAGVHTEAPLFTTLTGPIIDKTIAKMTPHFALPSDRVNRLMAKLTRDGSRFPAVRDLVSFLFTKILGGSYRTFSRRLPAIAYKTLSGGCSTKVYRHFRQMFVAGQFQPYDFSCEQQAQQQLQEQRQNQKGKVHCEGASENMAVYGSAAPPNLLEQYDRIDVPCHFVMGLDDKLIAPSNVLQHYNALRSAHPEHAFLHASPKGFGHVDFTLGCDDELISTIVDIFRLDDCVAAVSTTNRASKSSAKLVHTREHSDVDHDAAAAAAAAATATQGSATAACMHTATATATATAATTHGDGVGLYM